MNWYKIAQNDSVEEIFSKLQFRPVKKKASQYIFIKVNSKEDIDAMPEYSYGQYSGPSTTITTIVSSGEETSRNISDGMIIISGVNKEKYFMTPEKFKKNYTGDIGSTVTPEQSERLVARYDGNKNLEFMASYGSPTKLMPGDYLVKEGNGYYRIAKEEFEKTYETF